MTKDELERQRTFLLDSIIDLELQYETGDIAEGDYDRLREDYTVRAAEVLRAIETFDDPPAATPSPPVEPEAGATAEVVAKGERAEHVDEAEADEAEAGEDARGGADEAEAGEDAHGGDEEHEEDEDEDEDDEYDDEYDDDEEEEGEAGGAADAAAPGRRRRKRTKRLVAGGMVVAVLLLVTVGVFAFSGSKSSSTPEPTTNAGRLVLAHQLESQGKAVDALKQYDEVLKTDPKNVEALSYRGWLLKLAGLTDQAEAEMDQAIAVDPSYPDVHFFKGMLLYQDKNDPADAIPEFQAFLASNPPQQTVQAVQGVLDQARQALAASSTTVSPTTTAK